ncbi:hypothetical protein ACTXT7_010825 [Hymenolepis weldensis]
MKKLMPIINCAVLCPLSVHSKEHRRQHCKHKFHDLDQSAENPSKPMQPLPGLEPD